jgi:hypothetical protein
MNLIFIAAFEVVIVSGIFLAYFSGCNQLNLSTSTFLRQSTDKFSRDSARAPLPKKQGRAK